MKVSLEFEIAKIHCNYCPLRNENDDCNIQSYYGTLEFMADWNEQMKQCPLKAIEPQVKNERCMNCIHFILDDNRDRWGRCKRLKGQLGEICHGYNNCGSYESKYENGI